MARIRGLPWGPAAVFLIACWVVTWPVLLDPSSYVVGHPSSDVWKHMWGHWFIHQGITESFTFGLTSDLIRFPTGIEFMVIDPVNAVLSSMIRIVTGVSVPTAYNLVIWFDLLFGALAAYALAREEGCSRGGATIAGTIYAFNPYILSFGLASGVSENLSIPWIPLCLLFLLRSIRRPSVIHGLLAGLFFFLTALGTWYYGFILSSFILVLLLREGLRRGGPLVQTFRPLKFRLSWRPIAAVALGLFVAGALTIYPARVFSSTLSSDQAMEIIHAHGSDERSMPRAANVPAVFDFVDPRVLKVEAVADHLYYSHYLGILVVLLALAGAIRERKRALLWILAFLFFTAAAVGPNIFFTNTGRLYMHSPLFPVFQAVIPFFDRLHNFVRFSVAANLAIALIAGFGFGGLISWLGGRWKRLRRGDLVPGYLLAGLILVDFVIVSAVPYPLPHSPTEVPEPYVELGHHDEGGILLLPYRKQRYGMAHHFYYCIHHGLGITLEIAPEEDPPLSENEFVAYLARYPADSENWIEPPPDHDDPGADLDLDAGLRELLDEDFRYAVLDLSVARPQEAIGIARELDHRFELVAAEDGIARIYRLSPPEER